MKIEVTQEDIDKGVRESCTDCPIACAARRAMGCAENFGVEVTDYEIRSTNVKGEMLDSFPLPMVATSFVRKFDTDCPVSPFDFEIEELRTQ